DELHDEPLPVEVAGEVEEMYLDRPSTPAERRPYADVEDAGMAPTDRLHARRVHAVGRDQQPGPEVEVRGREAERPSPPVAGDDAATERVRPPEQTAGAGEVPL